LHRARRKAGFLYVRPDVVFFFSYATDAVVMSSLLHRLRCTSLRQRVGVAGYRKQRAGNTGSVS
jgi:hypothetical protein